MKINFLGILGQVLRITANSVEQAEKSGQKGALKKALALNTATQIMKDVLPPDLIEDAKMIDVADMAIEHFVNMINIKKKVQKDK